MLVAFDISHSVFEVPVFEQTVHQFDYSDSCPGPAGFQRMVKQAQPRLMYNQDLLAKIQRTEGEIKSEFDRWQRKVLQRESASIGGEAQTKLKLQATFLQLQPFPSHESSFFLTDSACESWIRTWFGSAVKTHVQGINQQPQNNEMYDVFLLVGQIGRDCSLEEIQRLLCAHASPGATCVIERSYVPCFSSSQCESLCFLCSRTTQISFARQKVTHALDVTMVIILQGWNASKICRPKTKFLAFSYWATNCLLALMLTQLQTLGKEMQGRLSAHKLKQMHNTLTILPKADLKHFLSSRRPRQDFVVEAPVFGAAQTVQVQFDSLLAAHHEPIYICNSPTYQPHSPGSPNANNPGSPDGNKSPVYYPGSPDGNKSPVYYPGSPDGNKSPVYYPGSPSYDSSKSAVYYPGSPSYASGYDDPPIHNVSKSRVACPGLPSPASTTYCPASPYEHQFAATLVSPSTKSSMI